MEKLNTKTVSEQKINSHTNKISSIYSYYIFENTESTKKNKKKYTLKHIYIYTERDSNHLSFGFVRCWASALVETNRIKPPNTTLYMQPHIYEYIYTEAQTYNIYTYAKIIQRSSCARVICCAHRILYARRWKPLTTLIPHIHIL